MKADDVADSTSSREDALGVLLILSLALRSWNFSIKAGGSLALVPPPLESDGSRDRPEQRASLKKLRPSRKSKRAKEESPEDATAIKILYDENTVKVGRSETGQRAGRARYAAGRASVGESLIEV